MKVGDLVTWKDGSRPQDMGIITAIENISAWTKSGTPAQQAWVSWNFLNGAEGRNFCYDLKVINEFKT